MKQVVIGIILIVLVLILFRALWSSEGVAGKTRAARVNKSISANIGKKLKNQEGLIQSKPLVLSAEEQKLFRDTHKIQKALKNAGFDPGVIDGKMGRSTKKALANFKQSKDLPRNSVIDDETLMELRRYFKK